MGGIVLVLIMGIALIVAPVAATAAGHPLATGIMTLAVGAGVTLTLLTTMLLVVTNLYVKTKASEAFVRTGMGGMVVVQDGGSLVIPVVHQVVRINLQTLRLEVSREGADALITRDKLRADVRAEFFVRVQPDEASIKSAARSFGEHMADNEFVRRLVEDKLVSALRTVAATKTLEELNSQRDEFVSQVTQIVTPDLAHNGLTLEVSTISKLDQTDPRNLREDNIFDAQGLRTIAETTQAQLTKRNELTRQGEQARKAQDVETRRRVLLLEQEQAEAEATQHAAVAQVTAQRNREAREKEIEAERAVEIAKVGKAQAIEVAQREQQMAVAQAEGRKQQAETLAQQLVEVAERDKEKAVAEAEMARANAEANLAGAQAERERARQSVLTVEVEAAAERSKRQQIIGAQAIAEQKYVEAQRHADGAAYQIEREAEAKKKSADADAEAVVKRAQAESEAVRSRAEGDRAAAVARAEGRRAEEMVPVEVDRQKVEVERQRVNVLQQELEAREKHGAAAQEFELAKLRIQVEGEVRIEGARAMAIMQGKVTATVYGTPEDVGKMSEAWMRGMGLSTSLEGFLAGAGPKTRDKSEIVFDQVVDVLGAVGKRVAGNDQHASAAVAVTPPPAGPPAAKQK